MLVIILLASIVIPGFLGRVREEPTLPEQKPRIQGQGNERPGDGAEPEPVSSPERLPPPPSAESVVEK